MSKSIKALAILGVVAGLGVAALPLSSYAAESEDSLNIGVQTTIKDYIAIESDSELTEENQTYVNIGELTNNGPIINTESGAGASIVIKTNHEKGYTVSIKADATDLTADGITDVIPAGVPAQNSSAWGYKASKADGVTNVTIESAAASYAGVTKDNVKIATGTTATNADGDTIRLDFAASADASQAAGTYKGVVTLTATATPAGA